MAGRDKLRWRAFLSLLADSIASFMVMACEARHRGELVPLETGTHSGCGPVPGFSSAMVLGSVCLSV